MHVDSVVLAALITASGVVVSALIERVRWTLGRVSDRIEGLQNGTRSKALRAIEELQRERVELELRGIHPRRRIDRITEDTEP